MGILKEMFGENSDDDYVKPEPVLLAKGSYKNSADDVMKGYKLFQKKYIYKTLVLKMFLVAVAFAYSVTMLVDPQNGDYVLPAMCLIACAAIGIYFVTEPIKNSRKVRQGLDHIEGDEYLAEITDRTIKISTISVNKPMQEEEVPVEESEKSEENSDGEAKDDEIPATLIHLDTPIVEIIDNEQILVVCVKKSYVFIIPQSAFNAEEIQAAREKLAAIMGVRYKLV